MTQKTEIVVGRIPVLECLRARKRKARRLFLLKTAKNLDQIRDAAGSIQLKECKRKELDTLSGGITHQGVVLQADHLPVFKAKTWMDGHFNTNTLVVILDGVEDPHNFGAIVRTAAAFGANAVIFGKDRSAPVSPVSTKSAAGAM